VIDHTDDGDGHADDLSVHVEEYKETDDGNTETRGAEKWSWLNATVCFIHVFVLLIRAKQTITPQWHK